MNLEKKAERKRGRRRRKGAMKSKNLTNETHFPSLLVSSELHIKPFGCGRWFGRLTFQNVRSLCLEMGIFPGSLTASQALISQRIGTLDMHGRLWAFKHSTPTPHSPIQPPTQHPSPYYSVFYPFIHYLLPVSPPPSSTLRFGFYHLQKLDLLNF